MADFKEISPENINDNVFSLIGNDWMLIAASNDGKTNAMTASWGGMGVLWNKNVVYCFIRPQRYTKKFVDNSEFFTLSFFDKEYKDILGYFGKVSGRDEDKIAKSKLTLKTDENAPIFNEARLSVICKKLYHSPLVPEGFIDKSLINKNYATADFHDMYVGEIIKVLQK